MPVDAATSMVHGHDDILAFAVARLRATYAGSPDPHGLLTEPFTMSELRAVHDAVLGERLLPDSFRRAMVPMFVDTGERVASGPEKPAGVWRRR